MVTSEPIMPVTIREDNVNTLLRYFIGFGAIYSFVWTLLASYQARSLTEIGIAMVATVAFSIVLLLAIFIPRSEVPGRAAIAISIVIVLGLLATGAIDSVGLYWVYFIPAYAFFVAGYAEGRWWVGAFLAGVITVYIISLFSPYLASWDWIRVFHSLASLLFISALSYAIARLQQQYQVVLEKAVVEYARFQQAVESSTNHIVITDANGVVVYANPAASTVTGYPVSAMLGNTPRLWGGLMSSQFYKNLWRTIKEERQSFYGEVHNMRKNGEIYTTLARISPVIESGQLIGFIGTEEEITQRVNLEQQLRMKLRELERVNKLMVGRELEMRKLKQQLKETQKEPAS